VANRKSPISSFFSMTSFRFSFFLFFLFLKKEREEGRGQRAEGVGESRETLKMLIRKKGIIPIRVFFSYALLFLIILVLFFSMFLVYHLVPYFLLLVFSPFFLVLAPFLFFFILVLFDLAISGSLSLFEALELRSFRVSVHKINGETLELMMKRGSRVRDLKKKICGLQGSPAALQKIVAEGKMLMELDPVPSQVHLFFSLEAAGKIRCPNCHEIWQEKTIQRHMKFGCPSKVQVPGKRKAQEGSLSDEMGDMMDFQNTEDQEPSIPFPSSRTSQGESNRYNLRQKLRKEDFRLFDESDEVENTEETEEIHPDNPTSSSFFSGPSIEEYLDEDHDGDAPHSSSSASTLATLYSYFLACWQAYFGVSNSAIQALLKFHAAFLHLAKIESLNLPSSLYQLWGALGIKEDHFRSFVVCPSCNNLSTKSEEESFCGKVLFPNHPQSKFRQPCGAPLNKKVIFLREVSGSPSHKNNRSKLARRKNGFPYLSFLIFRSGPN